MWFSHRMKILLVLEQSVLSTRLLIYWNVVLKCLKRWFYVFRSNLIVCCSHSRQWEQPHEPLCGVMLWTHLGVYGGSRFTKWDVFNAEKGS